MEEKEEYLKALAHKGLFAGASWPVDHGDNRRSKYYPGGLKIDPSKPIEDQIQITKCISPQLDNPQILYTREKDQVYVCGGLVSGKYIARVNAQTMEVEQHFVLPTALYQGGALMHENGDVYHVHGRKLYRFKKGELKDPEIKELPNINGDTLTISNGLLTLENGLIVLKLWTIHLDNMMGMLPFVIYLKIWPLLVLLLVLFLLEFLVFGSFGLVLGLVSFLLYLIPSFLIFTILFDELVPQEKVFFRFRKYFTQQPGIFLLVDPETMEIVYQEEYPDPSTGPRLSIANRYNDEQEIAVLGEEYIQKFVYSYKDSTCRRIPDWQRRYRTPEQRATVGTGPTTIGRTVYFTNNTFPEPWRAYNYTLYSIDLDTPSSNLSSYQLTSPNQQGYMWWSVVSDPKHNRLFIWDSLAGSVFCFDRNLHLIWQKNQIYNSDCMVCSPTSGHLYCTSIETPVPSIYHALWWQFEASVHKYLVVLDTSDGSVIGKVRLTDKEDSPRACNFMIGNNDDIFVGIPTGLVRVSSKLV